MPLRSLLLSGNDRLEACLVQDSAHVTIGDKGDHVILVQDALRAIDAVDVAPNEIEGRVYGPSTAAAVLSYKKARKIINRSYQSSEDNIVGKMTIKSLDDDLVALEGNYNPNPGRTGSLRCPDCTPPAPRRTPLPTPPPHGVTKRPF